MSNIFPIDFEEKLTMAQNDYILFSDSEDGNKIKKAQYKNLKGEPGTPGTPGKDGEDGAAATITVGSTTTGAAGSSASVTNSGTSSAAVLDFTIPQGAKGEPGEDGQDGADGAAATITVGTTTTLPAGSSATVTNVGTSQDAILNFGIPKGDAGTGSGDVIGPNSSTDGDVALFDGATGKLIKDSGASLADYQEKLTAGTNIQISNNVISATGGSDIVYATQAEYNALLPGALTDGKHYFIYSTDGGGGWTPGVNTLGYRPLTSSSTVNDQSGNNYTLTNNGVTFTTLGGVDCANFNGSSWLYNTSFAVIGTGDFTLSIRGYPTSNSQGMWLFVGDSLTDVVINSVNGYIQDTSAPTPLNNWTYITFTRSSGNLHIYSNGTEYVDAAFSNDIQSYLYIGKRINNTLYLSGGLSNCIVEDRAWTATEITDYFNNTKANYGIS